MSKTRHIIVSWEQAGECKGYKDEEVDIPAELTDEADVMSYLAETYGWYPDHID